MKSIAVILRRPPYGDISAAEAVRHAMGAAGDEATVSLILIDGGVLILKKHQEVGDTGFMGLGEALKDSMDMGVEVYVDRQSMREQHLDFHEVPHNVKAVNSTEIAGLISEAGATMIF